MNLSWGFAGNIQADCREFKSTTQRLADRNTKTSKLLLKFQLLADGSANVAELEKQLASNITKLTLLENS